MKKALINHAVAPNLLDAVADPEIAFTMVLANLMSSRLWEEAEKLPDTDAAGTAATDAGKIQRLIDRHYEHVTPQQVFATNGTLDLEAESRRLGRDVFDYTLQKIRASMAFRAQRGTYDAIKSGLEHFERGELPAYLYATIDEAYACRRLMRGRKHKPHGITCCLDEAALFAAMMLARRDVAPESMLFLGSPAHYTVLCWNGEDVWWFYSKHEIFSVEDWARVIRERYDGDWQLAFNDRLPGFDRLMATSGLANFHDRELSIPAPEFTSFVARIDAFFGGRVAQLDEALELPLAHSESSHIREAFDAISEATGAAAVRDGLRQLALRNNQRASLRALYAYRTLDVPDPNIYLDVARRSACLGREMVPPQTLEEAIGIIADIEGNESIFDDRDRIAMPDETLRFSTGTDRDKALLVHVILERLGSMAGSGGGPVETVMTAKDSYVTGPDFCISVKTTAQVPAVEGEILYRFGAGNGR